jgi:hypothetical protein
VVRTNSGIVASLYGTQIGTDNTGQNLCGWRINLGIRHEFHEWARNLFLDSTAKRVLYRRDRRVRRAILKKISALSAFSAMSFCSELIR